MDLYLLMALFLIYLVTAVLVNNTLLRRIWLLALMSGVVLMSVAIILLKSSNEAVMLSGDNFNWYYLLYLFASMTVVLGLINVWMYRRELWHLLKYNSSDAPKKAKE